MGLVVGVCIVVDYEYVFVSSEWLVRFLLKSINCKE